MDSALDHFLKLHGTRVYAAALRIVGDGGVATDVAHEALMALRNQPHLVKTDGALAWTLRVVNNRALDRLRREHREAGRIRSLPDKIGAQQQPEPLERLVLDEEQALLWRSLARLPERQRQVVVLRAIDGLSFVRIADQLGISQGACKVHYRRGMASLSAWIAPDASAEESL